MAGMLSRRASEYLLPWLFAQNLFRPDAADNSVPVGVERLQRWRANLGAVAILVLSLPFLSARGIVDGILERSVLNATIATVVVLALGGALIASVSGSPQARHLVLYRAKPPAKRVLAAVAMCLGALLVLAAPLPSLFGLLVYLWYAVFMLTALFYMARYLFGTEELHPVLGPVVEIVVVSLVTAVGILSADGKGLPAWLAVDIAICAWLTAMPLSACEIWLRRDTLRRDFFWDRGVYRDSSAAAAPAASPSHAAAAPAMWRWLEVPSPSAPVRTIDGVRRYRNRDGSVATPIQLGEAVEIAMAMDHQWTATHRPGAVHARDGERYEVNADAAAKAYEAISMLIYRTVIVPARLNVSEWHRLAGFPGTWRNSQRLAAAIARYEDGRWRATPVPPTWAPGEPPMDDELAGATAWALTTFPEDDIWNREELVDLDNVSYWSPKPWAFATDRRVTVRLATTFSRGASPAAAALLAVNTGLRDPGHDWSHR